MPDREPTRMQDGISFVVLLALAAATAGVALTSLLPARENLHRTRINVERQQLKNDTMQTEVEGLRENIALVESDPWTIQRILRDEHGLAEQREIRVE